MPPTLRVRIEPDVRDKWKQFLAETGLSEQEALTRLVQWLVAQDDLVQALVMGQVRDARRRKQLAEVLLRELGRRRKG